ncbi:MAG: FAD-dependent oxidoreductase [Parvularculaceae bacterium]|nr:FAD-dependent oxidoreductase [Parvularculaceae bacterium]
MSGHITADICVIGAGSAGLSFAAGAAQLGRKVVLVEKGKMGGDCLNFGCVPSKALIAAANAAHSARTAAKFGVTAQEPHVDFAAVHAHVQSVIAAIAPHDSQQRFESLGVTVIRQRGEFIGPRVVKAGGQEIHAKHFVIATGSSPFIPPINGLAETPYLTNETIFDNKTLPDHLIVIGGGPIGAELAQAHRRLGARVTIIEAETLLGREDEQAVDLLRAAFAAEGVEVFERTKVMETRGGDNGVIAVLEDGRQFAGSHLLVAVGRRANISGLGLDKAGVEFENGKIRLDASLRTTNRRIYAAGDAAGGAQFTHVAGDHASTLIRNILFKMPAARRDSLAPRVTYTDPEIASVGVTEEQGGVTSVQWDFENNDRAQTEKSTHGFLKAYVDRKGTIAGATLVGKGAGDEIGLWSFAIANGLKIKSMTNYIAPYPTRGEISKRAGGAYFTPKLFSGKTRSLVKLLSMLD